MESFTTESLLPLSNFYFYFLTLEGWGRGFKSMHFVAFTLIC